MLKRFSKIKMDFDWERFSRTIAERTNAKIIRNVKLNQVSRWKIGGIAPLILQPASAQDVSTIVKLCNMHGVPRCVIGDTSNLLFDDEGLHAVVINISSAMAKRRVEGASIIAGAGCWVPALARFSASAGLAGLEHIVGIPGRLGGLVSMNGGSQRKGIGDNIESLTAVDSEGRVASYSKDDCRFSYRNSIFLGNQDVITSVVLKLTKGSIQEIRRSMLGVMSERRAKFPIKSANCGSVFASDPAMYEEVGPPGLAIEKLGLKGFSVGDATVSLEHANFFVNSGGCKSSDMRELISHVKNLVIAKTGYSMRVEVKYVSPLGELQSL